jgi:hypothetical protein
MIDFNPTSAGPLIPAMMTAADPFGRICSNWLYPVRAFKSIKEEVRVGETRYRLRSPAVMTFYPYVSRGKGQLIAESAESDIDGAYPIGEGETYEEAFEDWTSQFHVQIQTLLAKRPWEMTPDERKQMAFIERKIDLAAYHRETPVTVHEIGTVARRRPLPDRIKWENGRTERINLSLMPGEFATFVAGQRFEAITHRDPITGRLRKVTFVAKLGRLKAAPADSWEKTRTSLDDPEVEWDEID